MEALWWRVVTYLPPVRGKVLTRNLTTNMLIANIVVWTLNVGCSFSNTAFATMQAMDAFGKRFGSFDPISQIYTLTPLQLALFNSLDVFTDILVTVAVRYLAERLGRRFVAGFIITFLLLGFAVAYTAQTFVQILVGRLFYTSAFSLNGSMMTMAMAEILPGAIRGKMISMNSILYNCGTIVAAGLSSVTSRIEDDRAWQYMLVSGVPCTALSIFVLCFIPESPRWLLRKGRKDDARRALHYIHGCRGDYDATTEVELLRESLEESEKSSEGKWKDLLHADNKRRMMILVGSYFFAQFSGSALSISYTTVFFRQVGGMDPFTATMIRRATGLLDPILSLYIIDRLPRRKYRMVAVALLAVTFAIMGGLGTVANPTKSVQGGIIAMAILAAFFRGLGFIVPNRVMLGEVPHPQLREKTTLVAISASQLFDFVNSFSFPYLLNPPYANLQSKIGLLYVPFAAGGVVFLYFCVPDLARRSLEEIEEIFREKVPAKDTRKWKSSNVDSAGSRITAMENGSISKSPSLESVQVVEVSSETLSIKTDRTGSSANSIREEKFRS